MADYLRACWYQAGWSDEIGDDGPLSRTILDEPVLFYRKSDGIPAALLDRCPHRFAPLSAGRVEGDRVTCGYHGLAFGSDGRCVHNPHGPVTSAMKVRAYPVVERHSAIWIWMGAADLADPATIPDLRFIDDTPEHARISMVMPTKANYRLVTDNIMDLSHTDFLHPSSLGGVMATSRAIVRGEGERIVAEWTSDDCDPPPAFAAMLEPGTRADIWTRVAWQAPAVMVLGTAAMPAGVPRTSEAEAFVLHNMTPETSTTTHYFVCATRPYMQDDAGFHAFLGDALRHAFIHEDKPMLEKQQARMGDVDLWSLDPILLRTDAAAVRVRRKLDRMIAAENN